MTLVEMTFSNALCEHPGLCRLHSLHLFTISHGFLIIIPHSPCIFNAWPLTIRVKEECQLKNWKTKVISTVLALSVMAPVASFAASSATPAEDVPFRKGFAHHQRFNGQEAEAKILEMVSKYAPESLSEWKNALARRDQLVIQLKEKMPLNKRNTDLPDGTKERVKDRPKLSDEAKEKIKSIREDLKNGKITREEAATEFQKLGLEPRKDFSRDNPGAQFRKAVQEGDEAKIKELLPQLLQQLKERNQQLSDRLSEINQ